MSSSLHWPAHLPWKPFATICDKGGEITDDPRKLSCKDCQRLIAKTWGWKRVNQKWEDNDGRR